MNRLMVLAPTVVMLVAGCSALSDLGGLNVLTAPGCGPARGMVLIVGAHRDSPAPSLDSPVSCQVAGAVKAGKPVRLVVAAGQPYASPLPLMPVTGGTLAQQNSPRLQDDVQRIKTAVRDARPASPGVDDLAALSIAADAARSAEVPHAELVVLDSGLDDRGNLDFTVPGMLAAVPADVVSQLRANGDLPDLHGFSVILVGVGYTAPPQPPLAAKWRTNLTNIWTAVVRSAGASVRIVPQPAQAASITTPQPVRLIPVPSEQPVRPTTRTPIVFTGASAVRFEPNSTAFVEPAAARRALLPIARWLAADRSRLAKLEGTTADVGLMTGQIRLSWSRADRVRAELVALGVSRAQISVRGVGSNFPQFTPDRSESGTLLAGPATLNRSVRITLMGRPA